MVGLDIGLIMFASGLLLGAGIGVCVAYFILEACL